MPSRLIIALGALFWATGALAQDASTPSEPSLPKVTVGVLEFGTAQWEMKTIQDYNLDEEAGIELEVRGLANSSAGDVALLSGDVDVILTDFIWVASQRASGNMVTNVPHSLAVGGLMVHPDAGIESVADLDGKTIGVAGGPLDKSWIILQAYHAQQADGGLADKIEARYGAPPLVNELLQNGNIDAALNFWHWNARMKAAGYPELVSVAQMLEEIGIETQPPLLGWAFLDATAEDRTDAIKGFLDASFAAKGMLLNDDAVWENLKAKMRAEDDPDLFEQLRQDYRAGIVTEYDADTVEAATESFAIMSQYGGEELVGQSDKLPSGTFWSGYQR